MILGDVAVPIQCTKGWVVPTAAKYIIHPWPLGMGLTSGAQTLAFGAATVQAGRLGRASSPSCRIQLSKLEDEAIWMLILPVWVEKANHWPDLDCARHGSGKLVAIAGAAAEVKIRQKRGNSRAERDVLDVGRSGIVSVLFHD